MCPPSEPQALMLPSFPPVRPSRRLRAALALAVAVAVGAPASALAHPGHHAHAGMPGVSTPFDVPFPAMGPSAGGYTSDNVEFVKNFPQHTDSAGARKLGSFFYITTERDLTIYDISKPADPVQVGRLTFPATAVGTPVFTEEDPDTNGRILLVSNNGTLLVIDVSDKKAPKVLSALAGADDHTVSCIIDCTWAYGSEGTIVDLRNPAKPRLSPNVWKTDEKTFHDVTEVEPGLVVTSSQPVKLLDARENPEKPTILKSSPLEQGRFNHANLWPRDGKDDFLLVGGEATGPQCSEDPSATFETWDARVFAETGVKKKLDEFRIQPGAPTNGRAPDSTYCVHWFTEHPYYENGGLLAISWYEHGTHFLKIGNDGKISEVGFFLGGGGQASAAYWIDERTVYVADYLRGLDVLRFTGDIGSPPSTPATDGAGPVDEELRKRQEPPPEPTAQASAEAPAPAATPATAETPRAAAPAETCVKPDGFRSTAAKGRGDGLALTFSRTASTAVTVDVFQQSVGRRVVGERLVARFPARSGDVRWNGKANQGDRKVTDGYYFVRYRTRTATGTDTRRIALRRVGGRWTTRPAFYRSASCDLLRSFKLERPVFGGRSNRALGITYQVERPARVTVTVLRGTQVVKRFAARQSEAKRTNRLRFDSEGLPAGDYRVRIEATRAGERVAASTVSRRL